MKNNNFVAACGILLLVFVCASGLAQKSAEIERLDPAADAIVPTNAHMEQLAKGLGFVEGPVWFRKGGEGSISNNGHGTVILLGSNGITIDKQGRITFCQHGDRGVVRIEKSGQRITLADSYEGKRLNSPNDLVYKSDGSLYFTDPPFGLRGRDDEPKKELPFSGVYRWSNGKVQLLYKDFKGPNGIAFSPDEKYLYVNDSPSKVIMRFEVQPDGGISNGKIITDMTSDQRPGGPDGMKVDRNGNIYCSGPGGFCIMSPEGKHIATGLTNELVANMAWGDLDGKMLYLTARTGLYRIHLNIAGVRP